MDKFTIGLARARAFKEILRLIKDKAITNAVDVGTEFQLQLNDDYMLRISGTEVNLLIINNPSANRARAS